jgi:hypothetical protein
MSNGNYPSKSSIYVVGSQGVRRKARNWFLFNSGIFAGSWFVG